MLRRSRTRRDRLGPLGAAMSVGQVIWSGRRHWLTIPSERRDQLQQLVRQTERKPWTLSPSDRLEFRELVRGLNLAHLVRHTALDAVLLRRRLRPPRWRGRVRHALLSVSVGERPHRNARLNAPK